jgi:hypothetical protein
MLFDYIECLISVMYDVIAYESHILMFDAPAHRCYVIMNVVKTQLNALTQIN